MRIDVGRKILTRRDAVEAVPYVGDFIQVEGELAGEPVGEQLCSQIREDLVSGLFPPSSWPGA